MPRLRLILENTSTSEDGASLNLGRDSGPGDHEYIHQSGLGDDNDVIPTADAHNKGTLIRGLIHSIVRHSRLISSYTI